jgi:hypothetical protein
MDNLRVFTQRERQRARNIIPRDNGRNENPGLEGLQGTEIINRINGATQMTHQNIVDLVSSNNNNELGPREVGLILRAIGDDLNMRAFVRHSPTG